jgi:dipeptidyl aminopeptidase/acylaminoacyl peptidase
LLVNSGGPLLTDPCDWSRDGKWILYSQGTGTGHRGIWALPITGDRKPVLLVPPTVRSSFARLSPDGRFFAFSSDESGRYEVYVRTFSPGSTNPGGKWQVSTSGGILPEWREDGKELFFLGPGGLMSVPVQTGDTFQAGTPVELFGRRHGAFTIQRDGQRFLASIPAENTPEEPLHVVANWTAALPKSK